MKTTVPPSPTGLYILCRSTLDLDFGTTKASIHQRMSFISGRRKTRRHVGRAIRRDYYPPVVWELYDFQLHALGPGIRHAVEAVQ